MLRNALSSPRTRSALETRSSACSKQSARCCKYAAALLDGAPLSGGSFIVHIVVAYVIRGWRVQLPTAGFNLRVGYRPMFVRRALSTKGAVFCLYSCALGS